jgi:hypothetical protein
MGHFDSEPECLVPSPGLTRDLYIRPVVLSDMLGSREDGRGAGGQELAVAGWAGAACPQREGLFSPA